MVTIENLHCKTAGLAQEVARIDFLSDGVNASLSNIAHDVEGVWLDVAVPDMKCDAAWYCNSIKPSDTPDEKLSFLKHVCGWVSYHRESNGHRANWLTTLIRGIAFDPVLPDLVAAQDGMFVLQ